MSQPASTSTLPTIRPSGPVCGVTRRMPRISSATFSASSGLWASFTPPPFPRPPAWIWALTTTTSVPSSAAMVAASFGLSVTRPSRVGTP